MIQKICKILAMCLLFSSGLVLFQTPALADYRVVTVTGPNDGSPDSLGYFYTNPYTFTITPTGSASFSPVFLSCDDFWDEINFGDSWSVKTYNGSSVDTHGIFATGQGNAPDDSSGVIVTNPSTNATQGYSLAVAYNAVAYMAYEVLSTNLWQKNATLAEEYSYAIWQIFDSGAVCGGGSLAVADASAIADLMNTALGEKMGNPDAVVFYTPDGRENPANYSSWITTSQEFVGLGSESFSEPFPEASTVAFLGFNFLALPGVVFFIRRRFRRGCVTRSRSAGVMSTLRT